MTASIMVQGAGSNVGKSVLVAGLCRYFSSQGLTVMPFKPQNMSNNAAVTSDHGEIGRAQALQARAARAAPISDMNPVLLKPETDTGAQIIVQGARYGTMRAAEYGQHKASLMPKVMESYARLEARADLVIIEGAGSPAEVNLRQGDLANMGFAEEADVPVILVGDIDRGGVIASLVGTHAVLEPSEKQRIKGFLINKFRGDTSLFADGMDIISDRTGWLGLGILPWFGAAARLPAEDILDLETKSSQSSNRDSYHVAVPVIRRIANFDDLDPLSQDPSFRVTLVKPGEPLPLDADLVLLPGSKSTIADLQFLREQGWDQDLMTLRRHGKAVIGLCGGYQMLGKYIHDPDGIEGVAGSVDGLGLLDIETTLTEQKTLTHTTGIETRTGVRYFRI
jgi:adenosylcobyric acid synthase